MITYLYHYVCTYEAGDSCPYKYCEDCTFKAYSKDSEEIPACDNPEKYCRKQLVRV